MGVLSPGGWIRIDWHSKQKSERERRSKGKKQVYALWKICYTLKKMKNFYSCRKETTICLCRLKYLNIRGNERREEMLIENNMTQ